jgi:hypothetical protein
VIEHTTRLHACLLKAFAAGRRLDPRDGSLLKFERTTEIRKMVKPNNVRGRIEQRLREARRAGFPHFMASEIADRTPGPRRQPQAE